jgi:uncharacterized membrane protein YgcG
VWPSATRPITPTDTSCASTINDWAYGVGGDLPSYFGNMAGNVNGIYQRYFARRIQYALGLSDNEAGDTHCEAQYQGSTHLTRGQEMQKALQAVSGGVPASQSFNYVPNVAHEDYLMMVDPNSQEFLFVTDLDATRAAATTSSSSSTASSQGSSTSSKKGSGSKTSSASGGSSSGGTTSSDSSSSGAISSYLLSQSSVLFLIIAAIALI